MWLPRPTRVWALELIRAHAPQVAVLPAPADRGHGPDKLYLAIDGTGVPMVPAAVTGRAGETGDRRAREVKLACLFTQTRLDEHGQPVRDPDSTSYLGSFDPPSGSPPWCPPRPAAAAPSTSANSSCSATAPSFDWSC
jgi:hypothetical protein